MEDNKNPFQEEEIKENIEETSTEENAENKEEAAQEEIQEEAQNDFEAKYEDLNNKYLRLAADFDNFRKRTIQEKEDLSKYASCEVLKKLTTVLDTFDRASEHLKNIDNCQTVKESYEVAIKQLIETLKKCGMEEIEALGKVFNPNEHEAITQVPTSEFEPDTIAFVAQKGYKMGDRIIRPALVGVAKKEDE
ncbi:MAG: nucleotide exchange factor GrpE [Candidatus Gastranaerophilales bacterium]|nr:nucleotide exchange factor GrpE [Candidatus Gastranaerophilales bacterium]